MNSYHPLVFVMLALLSLAPCSPHAGARLADLMTPDQGMRLSSASAASARVIGRPIAPNPPPAPTRSAKDDQVIGLAALVGLARGATMGPATPSQLNWNTNVRVDRSPAGCCDRPTIAADVAGWRYAVWEDERGANGDILFNHAPPGEDWNGEESVIVDPTYEVQRAPDIASDSAGNTYAVWADYRGEENWDVYFAFRPAGGDWGLNIQVNDNATGHQSSPAISVDSAGNACVVWEDARNDTGIGNRDIYADCRSAGGTWGQDRKVNDDTGTALQRLPAIAAGRGGQFCAAWWDQRRGYQDTYFACREVNGTWGANERVNDVSKGQWSPSERGPALAIDGTGTAYVLWEDYRAGNWDVYFAYRPPSGFWQGHRKINDDLSSDQSVPAISVSPAGDLTAVWWDMRDGNGDIYSDYRPTNGDWGTDARVNDDTGNARQEYPDVTVDVTGKSHAIWGDYREGTPHIYSASAPAPMAMCIVSNTADSGPGTLRACLTQPQPDQAIRFDLGVFPSTAPATITLLSALPAITTGGLNIDASNAGVVLDGHLLTGFVNGLHIDGATNVVIRGLQILNFPDDGIELGNGATGAVIGGDRGMGGGPVGQGNLAGGNKGAGIRLYGAGTRDNSILGNLVGTNISGTVARGNTKGIAVAGAIHNLIGGASPDTRNVVSGNSTCGLLLNMGASNNRIAGNLIGTDIAGKRALGNEWDGICIWDRASYNVIGGDYTSARNIISGNSSNGVTIGNAGVISNTVSGNLIGTDVDGVNAVGNGSAGIIISDQAAFNVIGGTTVAERNLISGNKSQGVVIAGLETTRNSVTGNYIGTGVTGETRLANDYNGILILDGAADNVIGGVTDAHSNLISGNGGHGIAITGENTQGNRIVRNRIGVKPAGAQSLGNMGNGVALENGAHNNVIQDNLISGNNENGLRISGSGTSGNVLIGNKIGSSLSGEKRVPNLQCGVQIDTGASNNRIGGSGSAEGNLISGNNMCGVTLFDNLTSKNLIIGNQIGTDTTGIKPLANFAMGVNIWQASDNTIGGLLAGERNLISGNNEDGVQIGSRGAEYNKIIGNYIGTDKDGTTAVRNGGAGVAIKEGASYNLLDRNLISGNGSAGVNLADLATTGNEITGNKIGVAATGLGSLGNLGDGIRASNGATKSMIGPTNIIAFNNLNGVYVDGSQTLSHAIIANSIFGNLLAGIKLGNGGNGGIAGPQIVSATCTHISGTALPNVAIEVFSDAEDEGRVHEGTTTSSPYGVWEFSKHRAFKQDFLTATQTDAAGNTSAFSVAHPLHGCLSEVIYLPVVHNWLPLPPPNLDPITPPGSQPSYLVTWSAVTGATGYTLEEARDPGFTAISRTYDRITKTLLSVDSRGIQRYYYRVKAHGSPRDSGWSNAQSVDVRWEKEPNYPYDQATGPLVSGLTYYGRPDNNNSDYFWFESARGTIRLHLDPPAGWTPSVLLYDGPPGRVVDICWTPSPPYDLACDGNKAGKYYLQIYSPQGSNTDGVYALTVSFP